MFNSKQIVVKISFCIFSTIFGKCLASYLSSDPKHFQTLQRELFLNFTNRTVVAKT